MIQHFQHFMPEGTTGFLHVVTMDDSHISRKNKGRILQKHKACGTDKTRWVTAICGGLL